MSPLAPSRPVKRKRPDDDHNATDTTPPKSTKNERPGDENKASQTKRSKSARFASKECAVCCEERASNQFPKLPHLGALTHERNTCRKCWDNHLRAEIENKNRFDQVSCPQCSQLLQESEVRVLVRKSTYSDYLDNAAKSAMQADEEYRACPSASCSWACFVSKEDGNIFTCRTCAYHYCMQCETAMHDDESCAQFQARLNAKSANEGLLVDTVNKISKACPNDKCQTRLDKVSGCDHITCSRCRHEFCWLCFAPFNGPGGVRAVGNTAHRATCRYSPGRLPNAPQMPPYI